MSAYDWEYDIAFEEWQREQNRVQYDADLDFESLCLNMPEESE